MKKKNSQSEKDNRPVTIQSSQRWKSVSPCLYRCFSFFAIVLKPQQSCRFVDNSCGHGSQTTERERAKEGFRRHFGKSPILFFSLVWCLPDLCLLPSGQSRAHLSQRTNQSCNVQRTGESKDWPQGLFFFSEQASFLKLHQERESLGDFFVRNLIAACS